MIALTIVRLVRVFFQIVGRVISCLSLDASSHSVMSYNCATKREGHQKYNSNLEANGPAKSAVEPFSVRCLACHIFFCRMRSAASTHLHKITGSRRSSCLGKLSKGRPAVDLRMRTTTESTCAGWTEGSICLWESGIVRVKIVLGRLDLLEFAKAVEDSAGSMETECGQTLTAVRMRKAGRGL